MTTRIVIDCSTGEETIEDLTVEEEEQREADALAVQQAIEAAPDPDDELRKEIEAATDVASLKAALLGSKPGQVARVAGRRKDA